MLNWRTHRSNVKSVCLICISPFIGNIHWNYTLLQGNDWHVIFHNSHRCHQFWQKRSIQFYTHVNLDICWLVYALYHSMHRTFAMKSMFRPNWPKTVFFCLETQSRPMFLFGCHHMAVIECPHTKKTTMNMCVRVKCSTSNGILSIVKYAYNEEKQPGKKQRTMSWKTTTKNVRLIMCTMSDESWAKTFRKFIGSR